ncbi:MAG: GNAT family N-acetyltransferase [Candidatus Promineofilum sp.]|nr:GNAT family N-acetyltransferase [Promineifilum sp.]
MTTHYDITDAPPIPGLQFRSFAGVTDAGALHAILSGSVVADGFDPLSSAESLWTTDQFAESLAAMTAAGSEDRTILAEIDGRPAGYNRLWDWEEMDGTRVWLNVGWVLPEWRGRGLGTALLHWSEQRTRELAAAQPGRWEYAANASGTEVAATALLRDNGYLVVYTVLEMGLDWAAFAPVTTLPPGIEMRSGDIDHAGQIAASIHEAYRGEFEGGRFNERFDSADYAEELTGQPHDPTLWRVAWAGDEVVGQVIPKIERGRAEIYEVSVRPGWRRGGVARALLSAALLGLGAREVEVVRLHTNAEFRTRAVDLYESLGFRVLKEFPRYRKAS